MVSFLVICVPPEACLPHLSTRPPARSTSPGHSSDSTLLLPSSLSTLKILPSHKLIKFLLTMRATHLLSGQKDYSTAEGSCREMRLSKLLTQALDIEKNWKLQTRLIK